jgi:hypothetical protein
MQLRYPCSVLLVAAMAGCATSNAEIKPLGDGLNVVTKSGRVSWDNVAELQKEGARHAAQFCGEQQRKAKIVDVKGFPAGMFNRSTRVETIFSCENA